MGAFFLVEGFVDSMIELGIFQVSEVSCWYVAILSCWCKPWLTLQPFLTGLAGQGSPFEARLIARPLDNEVSCSLLCGINKFSILIEHLHSFQHILVLVKCFHWTNEAKVKLHSSFAGCSASIAQPGQNQAPRPLGNAPPAISPDQYLTERKSYKDLVDLF